MTAAPDAAAVPASGQPGSDRDIEDLSRGLVRLGWRRDEAREALRRARERLLIAKAALSPENLLTAAIRGERGGGNGAPPPAEPRSPG